VVEFDKPVAKEILLGIKGVISAEEIHSNTWKIKSAKGKDIRADLFQMAVAKNLSVITLQKEESNLENIFRQLTTPQ
jgi:ABC-type uncharacterized transport system ATPase subunit